MHFSQSSLYQSAANKLDHVYLHNSTCITASAYNYWVKPFILYTVPVGGFGAWDSRNCRVLRETEEEVECGCDHLTHFAILLVSDGAQGL